MKQKQQYILIIIFVGAAAAGAGFFGGMQYQKLQTQNRFQQARNGVFMQGRSGTTQQGTLRSGQGLGMGFRPISGEITAIDASTLTVKLTDGSSKIVTYSDKTTVHKAEQSAVTDLKSGENVTIFGTETNGTVNAQTITIGEFLNRQMVPVQAK